MSAEASLAAKREALERILQQAGSLLVAYSGGVDSSCLAVFAHRVLGTRALAVTADSESLAGDQRELALDVARRFGFPHRVVRTSEMENPLYVRNHADRCYHCKSELFRHLLPLAEAEGLKHVAYGLILDDLADFRPGQRAATEAGSSAVGSPSSRERARTSAFVRPASASGARTPASVAARWPGRKSARSSRIRP